MPPCQKTNGGLDEQQYSKPPVKGQVKCITAYQQQQLAQAWLLQTLEDQQEGQKRQIICR